MVTMVIVSIGPCCASIQNVGLCFLYLQYVIQCFEIQLVKVFLTSRVLLCLGGIRIWVNIYYASEKFCETINDSYSSVEPFTRHIFLDDTVLWFVQGEGLNKFLFQIPYMIEASGWLVLMETYEEVKLFAIRQLLENN